MNPYLRELILQRTVKRRRYITPKAIPEPLIPPVSPWRPILPSPPPLEFTLDAEPFLRKLTPLVFERLLAHHVVNVQPMVTRLQVLAYMGMKLNHRGQWEQVIEQMPVEARTTPLKTRTSLDLDPDDKWLLEALARDLVIELDADLLRQLWPAMPLIWQSSFDSYGTFGQRHTTLWRDIFRASWQIDKQIGPADKFCIVNNDAYEVLLLDSNFQAAPESAYYYGVSSFVGTLWYHGLPGIKVFHNWLLSASQQVLVGGKRNGYAGMTYLPHRLLAETNVSDVGFAHSGAYVPMQRQDGYSRDMADFYISIGIV